MADAQNDAGRREIVQNNIDGLRCYRTCLTALIGQDGRLIDPSHGLLAVSWALLSRNKAAVAGFRGATGLSHSMWLFVMTWIIVYAAVAAAAPPANLPQDHPLEAWFKSLKQPGSQRLCCSISDCRFIAYDIRDSHYEVKIEGWTYVVPNESILRGMNNSTDKAVVCYSYVSFGLPAPQGEVRKTPQDTMEILCFVPPKPLS